MKYGKPHLSFEDQLAKLESRGLAVHDPTRALQLLQSVGYYGWSAYVYPFRLLLPEGKRSGFRYRSDELRADVTWSHIEALWAFDRKLRHLVLDAAETIEVGFRTRLAYRLGARDPFGHLTRASLSADACDRKLTSGITTFGAWEAKYRQQQSEASGEDFVKHHRLTYDESEIPIWVAVEFLSFGSVVRLLSLTQIDDQNAVARPMGVSSGKRLHGFLMSISHVRNIAAHHGRLWNRQLGTSLGRFHPTETGPDLFHLAGRAIEPKLYGALSVMAYLVRNLDPTSNWPRSLSTLIKKFPQVPYLSPEVDMGFRAGWSDLPLWVDAPRGTGFAFPPP